MLDFRRYREMDGPTALAAYLDGLPDPAPGRKAVKIALSRLAAAFRRGHHQRLALSVFQPLVENREGGMFPLPNGDLVIAAAGLSDEQWSRGLLRLESWLHEAEIEDPDRLIEWVDLETIPSGEAAALLGAALPPALERGAPKHDEDEEVTGARNEEEQAAPRAPSTLDPTGLNRLLDRLGELDPLKVLAKRSVCAVTPNAPPQQAFQWVGVDLAAAATSLDPAVSIEGAGWLARAFADRTDERLLVALAAHPPKRPAALSLGLSVLLGEAFERFDAALGAAEAVRPVLIIPKADIFADTASWFAARDLLRRQGYKLGIGGLTRFALPLVDRDALGADLLFLAADSGLTDPNPDAAATLTTAIKRAGTARVVLTGVDRDPLREAGTALGIALMSGKAIRPGAG